MLTADERELLLRMHKAFPQFESFLVHKLQEELNSLPSANLDKVQVFQGRCIVLQELLLDLRTAAGITADRITKPKL